MAIPVIDERVRHVGPSYLRKLSSEVLKQFEGLLVVQDDEAPLVVILPYRQYLEMQEALRNGVDVLDGSPEYVVPPALRQDLDTIPDNRPKNCRCLHCGEGFAGPKWATICSGCKSVGHTGAPANCPPCLEAQGGL